MYAEKLPRNRCHYNAHLMQAMHPELAVIEGYLILDDAGTERRMEHWWNQAPDGQRVDSTAWSYDFPGMMPYRYEACPGAWARMVQTVAEYASELEYRPRQ